jgi:diaminopimelate epimerase
VRPVPFCKMSSAGNDFIIVDNRTGVLNAIGVNEFARRICTPRMSLGGDQLMIIEGPVAGGDFSLRTINPDGAEVAMCGNAARCVARYAHQHGIAGARMTVDTLGGPVLARVDGEAASVELRLTSPVERDHLLAIDGAGRSVHLVEVSGAPHAVLLMEGVAGAPRERIHGLGATIRHHPDFPRGINVNFVEVLDRHRLWQRTFERGIEGETLACGTGAVASSVIAATLGLVDSPVRLRVLGGELAVRFERQGDTFRELVLAGDARFVAEGALHPEAWSWPTP